jgi:spermidine synthase
MAPALGAASVLSGLAALVYQVLWSRQLALVLGTSTEAVGVVLSSFMGGLGLGNALAARVVVRAPAPTLRPRLPYLYAALEGTIAVCALLLPFAFARAPALLGPLYGEGGGVAFRASRGALAFLLLVLPTTAMGATLPILVALARPSARQAASAAGALYAANTVGAVVGALLTPLLLLPSFGITRAGFAAVAANVAAGLLAVTTRTPAKSAEETLATPADAHESPTPSPIPLPPTAPSPRLVLGVSFLSGLGALAHETAWTRSLVLLVGPTTYAFAFVVASVIAGLAAGSALSGRFADRLRRPAAALALAQVGIVACAFVVVPLIGVLPIPIGEAARALVGQPGGLILREGFFTLLLLFLPSALFGASFPLAVRLLADAGETPGAAVGRVLAWNTAGALLGPLLAGFALLPFLGLQWTLQVAAAFHALAALVALAAEPPPARSWLLRAAVLAPALGLALLPRWDRELLAGGAYRYGHREQPGELLESLRAGELLYYRDGAAATVSVKRLGNSKALAVDGKVDATNTADMATQGLLAHLPLLLHGGAREALVVGLGSGATAAAALSHPLEHLDVVEISPEVVEAARRHFGDVQGGALDDPRLRLHVTDARHHLQLTPRRFDVILSEPSNPWMAGVASLFTREFFTLARGRLREGGLFCQWMHVYGMAVEDVRTVVGGFADVFPASSLFQVTEGDLLLVGAADAWPTPSAAEMATRMTAPSVAAGLRRVGLTRPGALGTLFVLGPGRLAAFASNSPRHTDDRPILELRAARSMLANTSGENRKALLEAAAAPAVEPWAGLMTAVSTEDLVERGRLLERSTGLALALEAYARALRLDPTNASAQEGLVRIGAMSEALPLVVGLLKTLAEGPDPLGARVSLAKLYRVKGLVADAGRELEAVFAISSSNVRALKLVAAVQGDLGQAGGVEIFAGRAATLAPDDAEAASLLASASLLSGDPAAALERADGALRLDPGLELALRVRALALARLGRTAEARAAFEALVGVGGESWQSWAHYGAFLADSGDRAGAVRAFEDAADLAPDSREAWTGLLETARAEGEEALVARAETALRRLAR